MTQSQSLSSKPLFKFWLDPQKDITPLEVTYIANMYATATGWDLMLPPDRYPHWVKIKRHFKETGDALTYGGSGQPLDAYKLLRAKLELECIGIIDMRLHVIFGTTCDDCEKLMLADLPSGERLTLFRNDIEPFSIPIFSTLDDISKALKSSEIRQESWYSFADSFPDVSSEVISGGEQFDEFAIVRDGARVARAWSVRRNQHAAEIAVETLEGYRQMGLGKQVVKAWVNHQLQAHKIPLYAHRPNTASRALVSSVGGVLFAEVTSFQ